MTDTVIRTSIEHADIRAEAVLEPWSGHGEGGAIAKVIIRGGEYGTYESTPADFQRAKADAARINAALNAHETRAGACVGKWHIPTITCSACGASLEQCPECRVIAGHMNDCSGNTQKANERHPLTTPLPTNEAEALREVIGPSETAGESQT